MPPSSHSAACKVSIQQVKGMQGLVMLLQAVRASSLGVGVVRAALNLQS